MCTHKCTQQQPCRQARAIGHTTVDGIFKNNKCNILLSRYIIMLLCCATSVPPNVMLQGNLHAKQRSGNLCVDFNCLGGIQQ